MPMPLHRPRSSALVVPRILAGLLALAAPLAAAELVAYWVEPDGADLLRSEVATGQPETVAADRPGMLGVAIDPVARVVYATDPVAGSISSIPFSGGPAECVVTGLTSPYGLAFDATEQCLYWTVPDRIQRAPVATGSVENVVMGLTDPVGIALDLDGGYVYWSEMAGQRIRRAPMAGGSVEDIISGLNSPYGVAYAEGILYWADWRSGRIHRAWISSGAVEDLVTGLDHPVGVAIDAVNGRVYWTDAQGIQCQALGDSTFYSLLTLTGRRGMIVLADMPETQPLGRDEEVWVDFGAGPVQTGTFLLPYMSISNALGGVANGGTIKIMGGRSGSPLRISTPVRIETFRAATRLGDP